MRASRRIAGLLAVAALAAQLAACSSADDWSQPHAAPKPVGALRDGFLPSSTPSPEATVNPKYDSWADVHPSAGFRVVMLTAGKDAPTAALVTAVTEWAAIERVSLRTIPAEEDHIGAIVEAMQLKPDLIVSAGNDLIDALAVVSPSHLDQHFLVVGAEVAEPTFNVTAVDWTGASFRGEGLGAASAYDPASFTPERTASAVRAGVVSILHDQTGIVLWLD